MARKNYTAEQIIGMLREAEVRLSQGERTGAICHSREFGGLKFQGNQFRLFAQISARELYQFDHTGAEEIGPQEV